VHYGKIFCGMPAALVSGNKHISRNMEWELVYDDLPSPSDSCASLPSRSAGGAIVGAVVAPGKPQQQAEPVISEKDLYAD
jgi:hypothetical protein